MSGWIDSAVHCGLSKYRPIEDVLRIHRELNIDGGVLIQHMGETDNDYIVGAAEQAGPSYRAVVIVNADGALLRDRLGVLAQRPAVAGLRVVAKPGSDWADSARAAAELGLRVVYFLAAGLDGVHSQLIEVARQFPTVPFVLSHLGGRGDQPPDLRTAELFATQENIVLQVSGFCMWPEEFATSADGSLRRLLEVFDNSRIVWGSNYPVCDMRLELARLENQSWGLNSDAMYAIMVRNPSRVWGIA